MRLKRLLIAATSVGAFLVLASNAFAAPTAAAEQVATATPASEQSIESGYCGPAFNSKAQAIAWLQSHPRQARLAEGYLKGDPYFHIQADQNIVSWMTNPHVKYKMAPAGYVLTGNTSCDAYGNVIPYYGRYSVGGIPMLWWCDIATGPGYNCVPLAKYYCRNWTHGKKTFIQQKAPAPKPTPKPKPKPKPKPTPTPTPTPANVPVVLSKHILDSVTRADVTVIHVMQLPVHVRIMGPAGNSILDYNTSLTTDGADHALKGPDGKDLTLTPGQTAEVCEILGQTGMTPLNPGSSPTPNCYTKQVFAGTTVRIDFINLLAPPPPAVACILNGVPVSVVPPGYIVQGNVCVNQAELNCTISGGTFNNVNNLCTIIQVVGQCSTTTIVAGNGNVVNVTNSGNCNNTPTQTCPAGQIGFPNCHVPTCGELNNCPPPPVTHYTNLTCTGPEEMTGGGSLLIVCSVSNDNGAQIALSADVTSNTGNLRVSGINCSSQGTTACQGNGTYEVRLAGTNDGTSPVYAGIKIVATSNGAPSNSFNQSIKVDPRCSNFGC